LLLGHCSTTTKFVSGQKNRALKALSRTTCTSRLPTPREPFLWSQLEPEDDKLTIKGGERRMEQFGEAVVLAFPSRKLKARWQEFSDAGASYDFPEYISHVTISYKPIDLKSVEPYSGELIFGPEELKEIDDDWTADEIDEVDL
jgi:hypothetical protein